MNRAMRLGRAGRPLAAGHVARVDVLAATLVEVQAQRGRGAKTSA